MNNYTYIFFFFRENHYEPEVMDPTVPFSRYSNFKITDNTVILVHGHQGSLHSEFNNLVKDGKLFTFRRIRYFTILSTKW